MSRSVPALLIAALLALAAAPPTHAAAGWEWPVRGAVITKFRNGSDPYAGGQHRGIDVAGKVGQQVGAATAGTVRFAGVAGSSGLTVSIRTADGRYDTSYLHLSSAAVHKGERVSAGQEVGAVGTTGRRSAVAPHLHFGVRHAGSRHAYVDPLDLLPPIGAPRLPQPRGAPAPVPVRVRPAPSPVRIRAPARAPGPARRPVRVPSGRRVRLPGTAPAPRSVPVPVAHGARESARAPSPRAVPEAAPAPLLSPAPAPVPRAAPAPHVAPRPGPDLGWALACAGLLLAAACIGGGAKRGEREDEGRRRSPLQVPLARLQTALRSLRP